MTVRPAPFFRRARSGFSLIEALVVLAIGGMALTVIFSMGIRAGDTGFALGRRAMDAADADIAISDLRSLIRSIALRPPTMYLEDVDQPIAGTPDRLEADVVLERATLCAPQGWAGRLTLSVERGAEQTSLVCQAGDRRQVLLTERGENAALSYSVDGVQWTSDYVTPTGRDELLEDVTRSYTLWVRFRSDKTDVVETAFSSRPQLWIRQDGIL